MTSERKKYLLWLFAIAIPVLQATMMTLICKIKYGVALPFPAWTDEAAYLSIIKTWSTEGVHGFMGDALGYCGYNGIAALVGHGGAYNPCLLAPYALVANVFGYSIHVMWYTNIAMLSFAMLLFLLITRPSFRNLLKILAVELLSCPAMLYIQTNMTELLRFAYAIILAGLIYRLYKVEKRDVIIRYILTPLFIIFTMQAYVFFVFVVPVYVWGILKNKKTWVRVLAALFATVIWGGASYYVFSQITSNYDVGKATTLLDCVMNFDIVGAIKAVLWMVYDGVMGIPLLLFGDYGHGLFVWYSLLVVFLLVYSIFMAIIRKKQNRSCFQYVISAFSIVLFFVAFIMLYSMEPFTFLRSTCIVVVFALYLMLLDEESRCILPIACFTAGMIFVPSNLSDFSVERYWNEQEAGYVEKLEESMFDTIKLNANDSWGSTVLLYTLEPRVIASMPAGSGVNMMLKDEVNDKAGYLLFTKKTENLRKDWSEQSFDNVYKKNKDIIDTKYEVAWEDDSYVIYKHKED